MQGTVNDGFENVGEAFDLILASDERMGAALSVRIDGELVIDLWGGLADPRSSTAWSSDTLNVLFSATKGFLTILTLNLVQN